MSARSWVKLWSSLVHNMVVRRLQPAVRWLYVVLLTLPPDLDGRLEADDKTPISIDDLVDVSALPRRTVEAGMVALERGRLIRREADGVYVIEDYQGTQESDSAARMRRHRGRHSARHSDGPCDAEAEAEAEAEEEHTPPSPPSAAAAAGPPAAAGCSPDPKPGKKPRSRKKALTAEEVALFESWWVSYPRHEAREEAEKAWAKLSPAERVECVASSPAWVEAQRGKEQRYILHASRFLNTRRWRDELPAAPRKADVVMAADLAAGTGGPEIDEWTAERFGRVRAALALEVAPEATAEWLDLGRWFADAAANLPGEAVLRELDVRETELLDALSERLPEDDVERLRTAPDPRTAAAWRRKATREHFDLPRFE